MCTCATAKRRRKQATKKYMHMAPLVWPKYKKRDATTSAMRLRRLIETERRIKQGGKK